MAKYDRAFLVPYLQDICALHYAELEVSRKMAEIQNRLLQMKNGQEIAPPEKPIYEEEWDFFSKVFAGIGIFFMLVSPVLVACGLLLGNLTHGQLGLAIVLTIITVPIGWFLCHIVRASVKAVKEDNEALHDRYIADMTVYQREKDRAEQDAGKGNFQIAELEEKRNFYTAESKKISGLLEKAYSIAVLPMQHRNLYAAVFLYEYFRNNSADDLDRVLNIYAQEARKDKLEVIIDNQRMSGLQQRMILAKQQVSAEALCGYDGSMDTKICQITSSIEEQEQYLRMLECNTATTAYFASADHLR